VKLLPLALAVAAFAAAVVVFRRGRRWSAGALAVFGAGAAVYGSGVVEIPSLESILTDLGDRLGAWTYLLVGTLAFLETSAFVGLIAPGEVAVVFGGFVAGQGKINPVALGLLVWFCAAAGDSAGYLLGRRLGRGWALKQGPRIGVTKERFELVERFFTRHGGKTIVIGRFIGFVRALAPFIAGASRLPYLRFLPASVIGAGLWTAAFVTLGYVSGRSLHRAIEIAKTGNIGIFVLLVLLGLGFGGYRFARRPEFRARVRRELTRLIGRETMDDLDAARKND
jgi:membrane protein DedA with SNARE-associated domain